MKTVLEVRPDGSLPLPFHWQQDGFGPGALLEVEKHEQQLTVRPANATEIAAANGPRPFAWHAHMGSITAEQAAGIDKVIEGEFERINPAEWQ